MWAITLGFAGAFFIRNILAYVFGILGPDTVETQLNRVTDTDSLINASDYAQEEEEVSEKEKKNMKIVFFLFYLIFFYFMLFYLFISS